MNIREQDIYSVGGKRVASQEENPKVANKARSQIKPLPIAIVASVIIIGVTALPLKSCSISKTTSENSADPTRYRTPKVIVAEEDKAEPAMIIDDEYTVEEETVEEEISEEIVDDLEVSSVDYSGAETFYNHIIENRNAFGSFADHFQSVDDVKDFINFFYLFDESYRFEDIRSSIDSQERFDEIVSNYYKDCASHGVQPQMYLLMKSDTNAKYLLSEEEQLAYNLKNGHGNDYTISNEYYTWFGVNLLDARTQMQQNVKNAPLIDLLREQYEQYRYVGNMLDARKYQKNDSLPIPSLDLYYTNKVGENGETIEEIQNAFSCPDWGIDNLISKYEEDTETKTVKKTNPNESYFQYVNDAFDRVLSSGRTR